MSAFYMSINSLAFSSEGIIIFAEKKTTPLLPLPRLSHNKQLFWQVYHQRHLNLMKFNKAKHKVLHWGWDNPWYQRRLGD